MLHRPVLALTSNRQRLAQENPVCGNPETWFDAPAFREQNLYATSFDFFVNWDNETICDEVWIKRISDSNDIATQDAGQLRALITQCDGRDAVDRTFRFLEAQGIREKYMLFRDVPEAAWADGSERVVELNLSACEGGVSHFTAAEIQEKIAALRMRAAHIGQAGLIYSTSSLEGYLSRQPFFWPGDVDTLLFDDRNEARAVIEFKKHTANSRIPFTEQKISNYLSRDILKYKSLALLRDRFQTELFVVYFPIPANIRHVIVEQLVGPPDDLQAGVRVELALPDQHSADSMERFARAFMTTVMGM